MHNTMTVRCCRRHLLRDNLVGGGLAPNALALCRLHLHMPVLAEWCNQAPGKWQKGLCACVITHVCGGQVTGCMRMSSSVAVLLLPPRVNGTHAPPCALERVEGFGRAGIEGAFHCSVFVTPMMHRARVCVWSRHQDRRSAL